MTAEWLQLHPLNPQKRFLDRAVARIREGAVVVYPTDSCYALGCHLGDKAATDRIRAIRGFDRHTVFTFLCRDLAEVGTYGRVDNRQFSLLKSLTPGPYTFVIKASGEAPRRVLHEKRKTIGVRIPEHPVCRSLLAGLREPLLSCTLILKDQGLPLSNPEAARASLNGLVDVVLDGGDCGYEPTTVIDLSEDQPRLIRKGKGNVSRLFPDLPAE